MFPYNNKRKRVRIKTITRLSLERTRESRPREPQQRFVQRRRTAGEMDVRRARATPPMQRPGRLLVPRLKIPADSAADARAQTHEAAQHGAPEPAPHLPASQCGAPQSVVFT